MLDFQGVINLCFTRLFFVGRLLIFSKTSPLLPDELGDLSYGESRSLSSDDRSSSLAVEHVARERLFDANQVGINLLLLFLLLFRGLYLWRSLWLSLFDCSHGLFLRCFIFLLCLMFSTVFDDFFDSFLWLIEVEQVRQIIKKLGGKLETLR